MRAVTLVLLLAVPQPLLAAAYPSAVKKAVIETGLAQTIFPATCPYTATQIMNEDFWPEPA